MMPRSVPAALSRHASSSLPAREFFLAQIWQEVFLFRIINESNIIKRVVGWLNNGQTAMAEQDKKEQGDENGDVEAHVVDSAVPSSSTLSDGAGAEDAAEHEAAPDAEEGGADKDPSEMAMSEGLDEVPVEAADGGGEAEVAMDYDEEIHGAAAIKIQSRVRGGQVRARRQAGGGGGGETGGGREAEVAMDYDEGIHGAAAIKIQSRVRGGQVRARGMRQQRGNPVDAAASLLVKGSGFELESFSREHEVAAIRIQSRARGMQVSDVSRACYH